VLAGASSLIKSLFSPTKEFYNQFIKAYKFLLPYSFTQYYWIERLLIVQNSSLLAKKPEPCFSFSVIDYPLRPTKNFRLGKLLIYQQP